MGLLRRITIHLEGNANVIAAGVGLGIMKHVHGDSLVVDCQADVVDLSLNENSFVAQGNELEC